MSHTPGPWTTKVSPHDNRVVLIDSKTHGAIGELVYADTRKAADAHLIAAAPELLEALQFMLKAINYGGPDADDFMFDAEYKALAAVSKAKGEAA